MLVCYQVMITRLLIGFDVIFVSVEGLLNMMLLLTELVC